MSKEKLAEFEANLLREHNEKNLPYTKQLPEIDYIELQLVTGFEEIEQVLATKILAGAEARAFTTLWRGQNFDAWWAKCHYPAYAAKFYLDDAVYVYASVCWQCRSIYLDKGGSLLNLPNSDSLLVQGFDAEGKEGQELLAYCQQMLPSQSDWELIEEINKSRPQ